MGEKTQKPGLNNFGGAPDYISASVILDETERNFVTILAEFSQHPEDIEFFKGIENKLAALGNPANPEMTDKLNTCGILHFMSMHIVKGRKVEMSPRARKKGKAETFEPSYLLLEMTVDGDPYSAIDYMVEAVGDKLLPIFKDTKFEISGNDINQLRTLFYDNMIDMRQSIWPEFSRGKSTIGVGFSSTLGLSVKRILSEAAIADTARDIVDTHKFEFKSAHGQIYEVRQQFDIADGLADDKWVLGGSVPPAFAEQSDDSWLKKTTNKFELGLTLFPRVLFPPIILLYLFIASGIWNIQFEPLENFTKNIPSVQIPQILPQLSPSVPIPDQIGLILSVPNLIKIILISLGIAIFAGQFSRKYSISKLKNIGDMFWVVIMFLGFTYAPVIFNLVTDDGLYGYDLRKLDTVFSPVSSHINIRNVVVLSTVLTGWKIFSDRLRNIEKVYRPATKYMTYFAFILLSATLFFQQMAFAVSGWVNKDNIYIQNRFIGSTMETSLFYPFLSAIMVLLAFRAYKQSYNIELPKLFEPKTILCFIGLCLFFGLTSLFPSLPKDSPPVSPHILMTHNILFIVIIPLLFTLLILTLTNWLNPVESFRERFLSKNKSQTKFKYLNNPLLVGTILSSIFINLFRPFGGQVETIIHKYIPPFRNSGIEGVHFEQYREAFLTVFFALVAAAPMTLLVLLGLFFVGKTMANLSEANNKPVDMNPNTSDIIDFLDNENKNGFQNHMISVQRLLPEQFRRRIILPLSLRVILRTLTTGIIRPGFLGRVGTVHSARWIHLPKTDNYLFMSNYDGSFESYLEDFITKVGFGLNAAWSHCIGFPKSKNLFFGGAEDGDRFKRWARGSMQPTPFWYSAYPQLNVEAIRRNSLIRDGLVRARSGSDAEAWFDLFGSRTREEHTLEAEKVQNIVFGGLKHLKKGVCLVLALPNKNDPKAKVEDIEHSFKAFLAHLETKLTFGMAKPENSACYLGLTANGLIQAGLDSHLLEENDWRGDSVVTDETLPNKFPSAFLHGMYHNTRSRILGDKVKSEDNRNDPRNWDWGQSEGMLGVLLIYAKDDETLSDITERLLNLWSDDIIGMERQKELLNENNNAPPKMLLALSRSARGPYKKVSFEAYVNHQIVFKDLEYHSSGGLILKEPFGFTDGVSNPILKGTSQAACAKDSVHLVNPGEFVLGYRDNRNFFPPSPQIKASQDPRRILPAIPDEQPQQYPKFGQKVDNGLRDLGRNGSYMVVRQLEQDVKKFDDVTQNLAQDLFKADEVEDGKIILQAKMMGRWHNGKSLATSSATLMKSKMHGQSVLDIGQCPVSRKPFISSGELKQDNEFLFGRDDPNGHGCPFGSHIRRANARDSLEPEGKDELSVSNRHRLLRRGRSYGTDGKEGTFFICLNADIERQFEFVQQSWINGPGFHGLSDNYGPISSHMDQSKTSFKIQSPSHDIKIDLPSFTTMRGGGYFFMPGKEALTYITRQTYRPVTATVPGFGL